MGFIGQMIGQAWGAGGAVMGNMRGGQMSSAQFVGNAQANEYNAAVKRQRAATVRAFGKQRASDVLAASGAKEEQVRRQGRFAQGTSQATAAQSGTGMEGSNEDVMRQAQVLQELDALGVRYSGQLEATRIGDQSELTAHDLETGMNMDLYNANLNRTSAKYALESGEIGAAGALISGGSDFTNAFSSGSGGRSGGANYKTDYGPAPRTYNGYNEDAGGGVTGGGDHSGDTALT